MLFQNRRWTWTRRAVEPLERNAEWERGEVPETLPSGV